MDLTSANCEDACSIALLVSYRGEPFCGFARQEGLLTVQGELENALRIVFRHEVPTVCAGRTDAGVHAIGQVASLELGRTELERKGLPALVRSLNALTHDNICVRDALIAPQGFSARFDADWREYRYRIAAGSDRPLLMDDYTWWIGSCDAFDREAMERAAVRLIGEHDFKSFCVAASAVGKNTVRDLHSVTLLDDETFGERATVVRVVGNAFLHSMVRTMVGTLVEVGCGRRDPEWVDEVLAACDRRAAGQTAPAKGLVFWHVEYACLPDWGVPADKGLRR